MLTLFISKNSTSGKVAEAVDIKPACAPIQCIFVAITCRFSIGLIVVDRRAVQPAVQGLNMHVNVLAFGIVKVIFSGSSISIELPEDAHASDLKAVLEQAYPRLRQLSSCLLAINNEYAAADTLIAEKDEIALIPPVSGG